MIRALVLLVAMFGVYAGSMVNLACPERGWACRVAEYKTPDVSSRFPAASCPRGL